MHYVLFDDIQPSHYALSFVPSVNIRDDFMAVAFVALDSEKLGEHVNDNYHYDFSDNMFPHYLGNKKTKDIFDEEDVVDEEDNDEDIIIASKDMASLAEYIPKSVLLYLISE